MITKPARSTIIRALVLKKAQDYIIAHPGCNTEDVWQACKCGTLGLDHLVGLGLVRRKSKMIGGVATGRHIIMRYYATPAPKR